MSELQGVSCTNFSSARRNWIPCRKMSCGSYYTRHLEDSFSLRLPTDDGGKAFVKPGNEEIFDIDHEGARFFHPYQ